ncbi:sigma-70 family RNA polymerase sigma factor [Paracidovorax wautersii]|uniref:RNA polymerase sigma factor (Sigma-70 family) n=1 Tax=Paracidovorax wautersii TaxID=1177982 RepID=A0ABU1I937_9BURK|nr:sigma-70 family RNA polymerase sigma factor [Paracidovorax wautersii]MDR6213735.1 RNA polymerase sigma factor (sigma-70 family) [Paracidovorax wautersii]
MPAAACSPLPPSATADSVQALYEAHHGWLVALLRRRLQCRDGAADLAHDTFVRVLQKPEALPAVREPRAYLTTIARGLLCDHWRRRSLEQAWLDTLAALPDELAPSPEDTLAILQTLQQLDDLLSHLAPKAREVFVLSQLQGLGYAQIAQQVGVSERSVKRYMAQGFELCLALA